ncbi:MAG: hypothetical protein MRERC_8c001 [Mycoplasmataceae bacterium RC_NB112A]|nr:MAG: hypothetical protein MRERC_11c010 [Mycoplasmataceae bacterium RC_NB112A]KLL01794.1 MAG: hypothetical protein MRERC_8c001 [Mycoplasmataceae bacterium RC_NB112A]
MIDFCHFFYKVYYTQLDEEKAKVFNEEIKPLS